VCWRGGKRKPGAVRVGGERGAVVRKKVRGAGAGGRRKKKKKKKWVRGTGGSGGLVSGGGVKEKRLVASVFVQHRVGGA